MTMLGVLAVGIGAAGGAWLRWVLGILLNSYFPSVPPGTLAANLIGGYVIGAAIAVFSQASGIAPEWRLLIITGFCGGLTTFSTFSAEIAALFQQGRLVLFATAVAMHVGGSLFMTLLGGASVRLLLTRS
ncbi:MAG TPA: fluoride efflux transporter CrcB [Steroidobacteraceae bacterium]|nr:fluoride efflux transporter CrcB [Steroidobacteraceae bacterium]